MADQLATAKKEVLVEIVKLVQKRGMVGSHGGWKDFLNVHDKKFGANLSDPSKRTHEVLLAFLNSFSKDDSKIFWKVLQCHSNREVLAQLKQDAPDNESPEQRLVRLTLEHPIYPVDYSFSSHEEGWMLTKLSRKPKQRRSNEIVAIDCEMVLCEDGSEALVNVCVVDRDLKAKLNLLVKPTKAVADYRTEITGISAKDLEGVTCSLVDVQKSMMRLLAHGTILVGHSLNNDLQALKIDHARVIDTSLIFKLPDRPFHRRPSLNDLCKSVLGYEVRKEGAPHNCFDDACAAMKLVLAKLEPRVDNAISLVTEEVNPEVSEADKAKLLVHGIPVDVPCEVLHKIFSEKHTVKLQPQKKIRRKTYFSVAIFKNEEEAHQAFENIAGDLGKDSSGRRQKLVSFQPGTGEAVKFYVRETICDNSVGDLVSNKRPLEVEASVVSKKLKIGEETEKINMSSGEETEKQNKMTVSSHLCEDHVKEIERLKCLLKERDCEISSLHKVIVSLARKQGL